MSLPGLNLHEMNAKAYATRTANQFGGLLKDELRLKLSVLINIVRKECWDAEEEQVKRTTVFPLPHHVSVNNYESIPRGEYNRALAFIREHDDAEWYTNADIPDDLFKDFFAVAEMHPEIEFDEERDYQYFRITDFKQRQSC